MDWINRGHIPARGGKWIFFFTHGDYYLSVVTLLLVEGFIISLLWIRDIFFFTHVITTCQLSPRCLWKDSLYQCCGSLTFCDNWEDIKYNGQVESHKDIETRLPDSRWWTTTETRSVRHGIATPFYMKDWTHRGMYHVSMYLCTVSIRIRGSIPMAYGSDPVLFSSVAFKMPTKN